MELKTLIDVLLHLDQYLSGFAWVYGGWIYGLLFHFRRDRAGHNALSARRFPIVYGWNSSWNRGDGCNFADDFLDPCGYKRRQHQLLGWSLLRQEINRAP